MKMYLRKAMQNVATYVELALSAFLTIVIVVLLSGISDDPCDWN